MTIASALDELAEALGTREIVLVVPYDVFGRIAFEAEGEIVLQKRELDEEHEWVEYCGYRFERR